MQPITVLHGENVSELAKNMGLGVTLSDSFDLGGKFLRLAFPALKTALTILTMQGFGDIKQHITWYLPWHKLSK